MRNERTGKRHLYVFAIVVKKNYFNEKLQTKKDILSDRCCLQLLSDRIFYVKILKKIKIKGLLE